MLRLYTDATTIWYMLQYCTRDIVKLYQTKKIQKPKDKDYYSFRSLSLAHECSNTKGVMNSISHLSSSLAHECSNTKGVMNSISHLSLVVIGKCRALKHLIPHSGNTQMFPFNIAAWYYSLHSPRSYRWFTSKQLDYVENNNKNPSPTL